MMQFLFERFSSSQDSVAFVDNDEQFRYGEILSQVDNYLRFITEVGIKKGEVVLAVGDYSPQMFCFILALMKNGNVLAPLTHDSVVEKELLMDISECQWFISFAISMAEIQVRRVDRKVKNPLLAQLVDSGEPGLLLFSSGSTGKPKAILHSFRLVLEKFKTPRSRVTAITFLMLDHFGGINTLLHIVSNLGTVVTVKTRTVHSICEAIQKYRVELLPTTPSFLNMLVGTDVGQRYDLSSLRMISYGTEVMPQVTLDRLREMFPNVKFQQTYGLSELGVLRSQSRPDGSLWVKVGGDGFKTKVVDGILWVKSDYAMLGYLNAESPFDSEGWFNTQDRVEVDGEYFKILGRVTDLINIGGQKVYPSEIEEVLLEMDEIEDAAIYGEKNNILGNIIVAEVALKYSVALDELKRRIRKYCSSKLAPFKVPSKVIIADQDIYSVRMKKVRRSKEKDIQA